MTINALQAVPIALRIVRRELQEGMKDNRDEAEVKRLNARFADEWKLIPIAEIELQRRAQFIEKKTGDGSRFNKARLRGQKFVKKLEPQKYWMAQLAKRHGPYFDVGGLIEERDWCNTLLEPPGIKLIESDRDSPRWKLTKTGRKAINEWLDLADKIIRRAEHLHADGCYQIYHNAEGFQADPSGTTTKIIDAVEIMMKWLEGEVAGPKTESKETGKVDGKSGSVEDTQEDISPKNGNYSWCAEAEKCAATFKKERDKGSQTSRDDFCIRYAEEHGTKAKGSTLHQKLKVHKKKWDPFNKYGRPKRVSRTL